MLSCVYDLDLVPPSNVTQRTHTLAPTQLGIAAGNINISSTQERLPLSGSAKTEVDRYPHSYHGDCTVIYPDSSAHPQCLL